MVQELRGNDFSKEPDSLGEAGRVLGLGSSAGLKAERVWICPETGGDISMYGLYVPSRLRSHQGGLPRVQDHPGLRVSFLAGTGLADYTRARESLGSLSEVT